MLADKLELMKLLVEAGSDPHATDYEGNTIFYDAVEKNNTWVTARSFITATVDIGCEVKKRNIHGRTCLHVAAAVKESWPKTTEYSDIQSHLMYVLQPKFCLDVDTADNKGITPLHIASATSMMNSWTLIQSEADIFTQTKIDALRYTSQRKQDFAKSLRSSQIFFAPGQNP